MDKATGKPFTVDGKEITAEIIFTAEKENGEIKVEFTFDGGVVTKDTELVVFETLYRGDNEIAVHTDINDTDQTVTIRPVPVIPPPTINIPKTGDETNLSLWLSIGAVAVGAVISFLIIRFRRKDEDDDE